MKCVYSIGTGGGTRTHTLVTVASKATAASITPLRHLAFPRGVEPLQPGSKPGGLSISLRKQLLIYLVPNVRLELTRLAALPPQSSVSTIPPIRHMAKNNGFEPLRRSHDLLTFQASPFTAWVILRGRDGRI